MLIGALAARYGIMNFGDIYAFHPQLFGAEKQCSAHARATTSGSHLEGKHKTSNIINRLQI